MSEPRRYSWEDYLYPVDPDHPDSPRVLRNLLGITDRDELHDAERALTAGRLRELRGNPELVPRTFDAAHWQGIHRHLFQDVYEWAGQWRTVDIGKGGHDFLDADLLDYMAGWTLEQVREVNMFAGLPRSQVVGGLAETLHAVNMVHPFREGNGRTQRILVEHVAAEAGWLLNWERIEPLEQVFAMKQAFTGDRSFVRDMIDRSVTHRRPRRGGPGNEPRP